jgi:TIR domain
MPRPIVRRLFLSWCHCDRRAKDALTQRLRENLPILSGVELRWWEDSHIEIGEDWRRHILARLGDCDYGVLLLSPGFFASGFIREHELPAFVGPHAVKGALPVGLKRVQLDGTRILHGVDRHQIFTHGPAGRFFTETRGADRERFALDLATAIRERILSDS